MYKTTIAITVAICSFQALANNSNVQETVDIAKQSKALIEQIKPNTKEFREEVKANLTAKGQVLGIQKLPITKFFYVEAKQGSYMVSADGRFVFEGKLTDVWHRKKIDSLEDARSTERTPLTNLGFNPEKQLASFVIGNRAIPRQGIAFVDPTSAYTEKFIQHLLTTPQKYNWTVILLPLVGGDQAMDRSRKLWCASDRNAAIQDLAFGTNNSYTNLKSDCAEDPIMLSMMLTDIFQITGLPHIVREDGLSISGYPPKFDEWLNQL